MKLPEPIGRQVPANRLDPRSASPQFRTAIEYEYRFTEYDYEYEGIRGDALFVLLLVLVLSLPRRTVLVLEAIL